MKDQGKTIGILGDGEVVWHSDFSFKERPTAARMLVAMEVPPQERGGNTYFLNCYAAYDALPEAMKKRVSGLTIKQADIIDTAMKIRPGRSLDDDIRAVPGPSHPIISTHPETGGNMLFLGRRHGSYVNGLLARGLRGAAERALGARDAAALLLRAPLVAGRRRRLGQPRDPAPARSVRPGAARVLYAAQVEGHRPYEAPDALTRPPHPRAALQAKA